MANIRLKKTESIERQKNYSKDEQNESKGEQFPTHSVEDELSKKRKMILTGITTGVTVAGATAAGILFLGPYSPFGDNPSEKKNVLTPALQPPKPEVKVESKVAPPHVTPEKSIVAPTPKTTTDGLAQVPAVIVDSAPPAEKPITAEKKRIVAKEKSSSLPAKILPPPPVAKADVQKAPVTIYNYDTQDGGPVIESSAQKKIFVSRDPNFKTIYLNGVTDQTGKYRISTPPPGEVYWKEEGKLANKITVNPPKESGLQANIPSKLNFKDAISWSTSGKVSFFRLEVASDAEFLNKVKVFSTHKTSFPAQIIGQGNWFVRIAALNLYSGSWDFTKVFSLEIEPSEVPSRTPADNQPRHDDLPSAQPSQAAPPVEEGRGNQLEERLIEPLPHSEGAIEPVNPVEPVNPIEPVNPVEATVPEAPSTTPKTED